METAYYDYDSFLGDDWKIALTIKSEGFDMDEHDWTATVKRGPRSVVCDKTHNSVRSEDGVWFITVNTSDLGTGMAYLITEIDIPDSDFADGYRHEVSRIPLRRINNK